MCFKTFDMIVFALFEQVCDILRQNFVNNDKD